MMVSAAFPFLTPVQVRKFIDMEAFNVLGAWEPGMERGAFCKMCYRNDDIDAACAMRFPWGSSCYSGDPPTTRVVGVILEAPWINTASSRASTVERSSTCTALCTWPSPFPRQQT